MDFSFFSRLHEAGCPYVTSTETPSDLRDLVTKSGSDQDRDNILNWLLDRILDSENKENDEDEDTTVVRKLSTTPNFIQERLDSLGLTNTKEFLAKKLDDKETLGTWEFLILEATNNESEEAGNYSEVKSSLQSMPNDPMVKLDYTPDLKLVPRDVEKDFPAKFKKMLVPSEEKLERLARLMTSKVKELEESLSNVQVEEISASDCENTIESLSKELESLKKFDSQYADSYGRSLPSTEFPEATEFGPELERLHKLLEKLSKVTEARSTISQEVATIAEVMNRQRDKSVK